MTVVRDAGGEATHLSRWQGLGRRSPLVAGAFAFFLLALAAVALARVRRSRSNTPLQALTTLNDPAFFDRDLAQFIGADVMFELSQVDIRHTVPALDLATIGSLTFERPDAHQHHQQERRDREPRAAHGELEDSSDCRRSLRATRV